MHLKRGAASTMSSPSDVAVAYSKVQTGLLPLQSTMGKGKTSRTFLLFAAAGLILLSSVEAWGSLRQATRMRTRSIKMLPHPQSSSHRSILLERPTHNHKPFALFQSHDSADNGDERMKRHRKHLLLAALGAVAICLLPLRSAASTLAEPLVEAATTATATYASNPPMTVVHIGSPISTANELRLTLRIMYAALVGAAVGKERSASSPQHAAGVRTMALVCSGAAIYTVCSMYGFAAAGRYDPSRMAANVASGVGFVGAGVITTTSAPMARNKDRHESIVHGLTTAAAIWLSAAIGVACGVGMPILGTAAAMCTITILRVGKIQKKVSFRNKRPTTEVDRMIMDTSLDEDEEQEEVTNEDLELEEDDDLELHGLVFQNDTMPTSFDEDHFASPPSALDRAFNETATEVPEVRRRTLSP